LILKLIEYRFYVDKSIIRQKDVQPNTT